MNRVVLVVMIVLAACGGEPAEAPAPPTPAPVRCKTGELVDGTRCVPGHAVELAGHVATFEAIASTLARRGIVDELATAVLALQSLEAYKRATRTPGFAPLDPAQLSASSVHLKELADRFTAAARELELVRGELARTPGTDALADKRAAISPRLARVFGELGPRVTATIATDLAPLWQADLAHLMSLRERVCDRPANAATGAACAGFERVSGRANKFLHEAARTARQRFDTAGYLLVDELAPLLDPAATVTISKAIGRGPSYGEPCGPESLCEGELACLPHGGQRTCETRCRELAKIPCPHGTHCATIEGLGRMCRRNQRP